MHRAAAVQGLTRRVAIAALVLPALVLVAMAARSYQPFGGDGGRRRAASGTVLDSAFTVVFVLGVVAGLFALWIWLRVLTMRREKRAQRGAYSSLMVFLLIIGFLALAAPKILEYKQKPADTAGADPAFPVQPTERPRPEPYPEPGPQLVWPLAVALGALIAVAVIVAIVVMRRRDREGRTREELEELERALDEAIDDLRRDPDPRRAVIAAYARMERALTAYGLPRRPAEAPYEYLHRVARELEAEGSMVALTELFEEAKFSEHSVNETMRGRAIDALTAVRTEVRTAAAT